MYSRLAAVLLVATALFASLAVACSDSDDDSDNQDLQGSESQLCGDLSSLDTALVQFKSLNSSSTNEQVKQSAQNVASAMGDVRDSATEVKDARITELTDAYQNFDGTVKELPSGQPVGSYLQVLQTQATQVQTSHANLRTQLGCP